MTKKHFIALADAIREYEHGFNANQLNALADFCQSQNPRFDRDRWIGYIEGRNGKNGGKIKAETLEDASARVGRNMFEGTP